MDSFVKIEAYCVDRGLKINVAKTQYIIFKAPSKKLDTEPEITINNVVIQPLQTVQLLGFTLDHHLCFGAHVQATIIKCRGLLGVLRKLSKSLPTTLLKLMFTALIRCHLEYANLVLLAAAPTHLHKLETIQKVAVRIIHGAPTDAHAVPLLALHQLATLEAGG